MICAVTICGDAAAFRILVTQLRPQPKQQASAHACGDHYGDVISALVRNLSADVASCMIERYRLGAEPQ